MGLRNRLDKLFHEAVSLQRRGDLQGAEKIYRDILRLDKKNPDALHLIGLIYYQRNDLKSATRKISAALKRRRDPIFHYNLAKCYADMGEQEKAVAQYRAVLRLQPNNRQALDNLARCYERLQQTDAAAECYRRLLKLKPDAASVIGDLARLLRDTNRLPEARDLFLRLADLENSPRHRVRAALSLPNIFDSRQQIETLLSKAESEIQQLMDEGLVLDEPWQEVEIMPFNTHYMGVDVRPLHEKLCRLYRKACPALAFQADSRQLAPAASGGRLRIGFLSAFFRNHSVTHYFGNLIAGLDREMFEVILIHTPNSLLEDDERRQLENAVDQVVTLPERLKPAQEALAALSMDVLCFVDLGMEPVSYFLAFGRYAPLQILLAGHPVTSGLDSIGWFISHQGSEAAQPQRHYSENLALVPESIPYTCYSRPSPPDGTLQRKDFHLPADKTVYLCPQMLMKIHPDMDPLFKGILEDDDEAMVVLVETHTPFRRSLEQRFASTLGKLAERIAFIPMAPEGPPFRRLLELADTVLDTIHFSGGRTSFDAFSVAVPVVTLPGEFFRGRQTLGLYRIMGTQELVAQTPTQYVELALRLANDQAFRQDMRSRLAEASGRLFHHPGSIRWFESFLLERMDMS